MMQMQITVRINPSHEHGYGNLEVHETVELGTLSFLEMASVLAQFHELAQKIQSERKAKR